MGNIHRILLSKRNHVYLLVLFLISSFKLVIAQDINPYTYQDLSNFSYGKLRDSLKKNWNCPVLYREKETQKKYKELWDARTEFIVGAIDGKNFIQEKEIYNYIEPIVSQIQAGNPGLMPQKPILLIDRSASANAYSIGGNIIAVNLGLISFAESREEIALVIAHELSHNILEHANHSMKEKSEWLTSAEYKRSLNQVLDSKYERFTRLKKVFEGYTFSRTRHSRYHEDEADSLAVVLLKNSHIPFDASFFLRLDSSDIQYRQQLKQPVKDYFTNINLPFEDWWVHKTTKGLSSKNYNFQNADDILDSLKTHPECKERYTKTLAWSVANTRLTPIPASISEKVNKMIIWNIFDNQNLTACLYRILLEKDKGNKDEWYNFMIHNIFAGLYYSDNQLNRFNSIKVTSKEYISRQYYELQTMLEQMPKENLETYYTNLGTQVFWQKMPSDARALKELFHTLLNKDSSVKTNEIAAKHLTTAYSNSMYCEFADHFITK
ncbi:MAG TPA: M48 family metalloprotease [Flavisolibacter sp.]|nr:M48 family metalloprotease [Flavisolibacter sp.]